MTKKEHQYYCSYVLIHPSHNFSDLLMKLLDLTSIDKHNLIKENEELLKKEKRMTKEFDVNKN